MKHFELGRRLICHGPWNVHFEGDDCAACVAAAYGPQLPPLEVVHLDRDRGIVTLMGKR